MSNMIVARCIDLEAAWHMDSRQRYANQISLLGLPARPYAQMPLPFTPHPNLPLLAQSPLVLHLPNPTSRHDPLARQALNLTPPIPLIRLHQYHPLPGLHTRLPRPSGFIRIQRLHMLEGFLRSPPWCDSWTLLLFRRRTS